MIDQLKKYLFGYDAVVDKGRRRAPVTRVKGEDSLLTRKRRKLIATTQDVYRNFTIARWAVQKHLDYVSSFRFRASTGNEELDSRLEAFMEQWSKRLNCDVRGRHPLRRMTRLIEQRAVVDGDVFVLKIAGNTSARGKLQIVESDRIANPTRDPANDRIRTFDSTDWVEGVKLSKSGKALEYAVNDRDDSGNLTFSRFVSAKNVCHHGYWDRFDQVRGISPIANALNTFQDLYEGMDYALAKIKVAQLFGLVFYRDAELGLNDTIATTDSDNDGINDAGYEVDFGSGPQVLDLNPGDKAEFLESRTPATETVEFLRTCIHAALKSLDIPFSFYDESWSNFYGSRGALMQYLKNCKHKCASLQEVLDEITAWRLGLAVVDRELILPPGTQFDDMKWEWVPDGVPWWDPAKEVRGEAMAIACGLQTPQRAAKQSGTDFYENIDAIAAAQKYAEDRGVQIVLPGLANTPLGGEAEPEEQEEQDGTNVVSNRDAVQ